MIDASAYPLESREPFGIPPVVASHPDFDCLGSDCAISRDVTVLRGPAKPGRGIFLGDRVMLFRDVRLVIGSLDENPLATIRFGNRVVVNVGSYLSGEGGLILEDDVLIGAHVKLLSAGHAIHDLSPIIAHNHLTYDAIQIKTGAWIGAGATILPGVTIGTGAVVGAGSVVTRDVPNFAVVAGNPARLIHYRRGFAPPRPWWRFWK